MITVPDAVNDAVHIQQDFSARAVPSVFDYSRGMSVGLWSGARLLSDMNPPEYEGRARERRRETVESCSCARILYPPTGGVVIPSRVHCSRRNL